ncbi:MAG: PadR family transcriptional regulator [Burkholderiaceae bacterium]
MNPRRGRADHFPDGGVPADFHPRRGGRRERLFEPGHIRLLILHLLSEQARHGYEIIRAIGELVGGEYSPSPGTIYPTLSLLEDIGYAESASQEGGRKQYRITAAGRVHLDEHRDAARRLVEQLEHGRLRARARGVPEIRRAMENLKTALRMRFDDGLPDVETVRRVADIIDRAAVEIGRIPS